MVHIMTEDETMIICPKINFMLLSWSFTFYEILKLFKKRRRNVSPRDDHEYNQNMGKRCNNLGGYNIRQIIKRVKVSF